MDLSEVRTELDDLAQLKKDYREAQAIADEKKRIHDQRQHELFQKARDAGIPGIKLDTHTFTLRETIFANVRDIDAFEAWCKERELDSEFIKPAPEKQRVNEIVRAALDNGEELPDGVDWYARQFISITENK